MTVRWWLFFKRWYYSCLLYTSNSCGIRKIPIQENMQHSSFLKHEDELERTEVPYMCVCMCGEGHERAFVFPDLWCIPMSIYIFPTLNQSKLNFFPCLLVWNWFERLASSSIIQNKMALDTTYILRVECIYCRMTVIRHFIRIV